MFVSGCQTFPDRAKEFDSIRLFINGYASDLVEKPNPSVFVISGLKGDDPFSFKFQDKANVILDALADRGYHKFQPTGDGNEGNSLDILIFVKSAFETKPFYAPELEIYSFTQGEVIITAWDVAKLQDVQNKIRGQQLSEESISAFKQDYQLWETDIGINSFKIDDSRELFSLAIGNSKEFLGKATDGKIEKEIPLRTN